MRVVRMRHYFHSLVILLISTFFSCMVSGCGELEDVSQREIVFSSSRNGTSQIFVMHPDGSGIKQITSINKGAYSPRWSPDGTQIVFTAGYENSLYEAVFIMNSDGLNIRPIKEYDPTTLEEGSNPEWSSDGKHVVYDRCINCEGGGANSEIFSYDIMNDTIIQLTNIGSNGTPSWSRDDNMILFGTNRNLPSSPFGELYRMNSYGGSQKPLFSASVIGGSQIWSPTNDSIVFNSPNGMALLNFKDSTVTDLLLHTNQEVYSGPYSWSPDSKKILIVTYLSDGSAKSLLYVLDLETGSLKKLIDDSVTQADWRKR